MTMKLLKSVVDALGIDFKEAVEKHAIELALHRFKVDVPAPMVPHPLIEACIKRIRHPVEHEKPDDFIIDYEIVDDTPPPPAPPTLKARKYALMNQIHTAYDELLDSFWPLGKRRLLDIRLNDILTNGGPKNDDERGFVEEAKQRNQRLMAIDRRVAEMLAEVEDLTPETIDSWVLGPLEGAGQPAP